MPSRHLVSTPFSSGAERALRFENGRQYAKFSGSQSPSHRGRSALKLFFFIPTSLQLEGLNPLLIGGGARSSFCCNPLCIYTVFVSIPFSSGAERALFSREKGEMVRQRVSIPFSSGAVSATMPSVVGSQSPSHRRRSALCI